MKIPLLVIAGPTGVGKTEESLRMARKWQGEIVISDSVQIYRYLDIGSGKPTPAERKEIPHHLLDILNPDEVYDTARFASMARETIKKIWERGKLPILVGGCGFYIRTLLKGIFPGPARDEKLREKLYQEAQEKGRDALHARLKKIDPISAARIHPHDTVRVIRALEVFQLTGKPLSWHFQREKKESSFDYLFISLIRPREELYSRINNRVEKMWEMGWVEEVNKIIKMGFAPDSPGLQSIGYREVVQFIQSKIGEEEAKEVIKKRTRNYAKRQIVWLRKENPVWITLEEEREKMEAEIKDFLGRIQYLRL
ncbi:MAG: tRNA (adenosine(37)-N6)-dimethylallyltransferase MiaA [Caldiserica bacterium]|nr:tRNA (adenosine(37)-N6)-dimethylallyltransferase MiaA [Caldisericota bacterium]